MSEVSVSPVVSKAAKTLANQRMVKMTPAKRKEVSRLGTAARFPKSAEQERLAELRRQLELSEERVVKKLK